ncbi:hypothetical protein D8859_05760 [Streptococcus oralis]|nr:hypothetical protein D8859_05760 [Streptococcus oralis]
MNGIDLGSPPEIRHLSVYLGIFTLSQIVFERTPLDMVAQTFDKVQGCLAHFMLLDDFTCPSAHTASDIDDIVAFFL